MNKLRKTFACGMVNFRQWRSEPTVWLAFFAIFLHALYINRGVLQFAAQHQRTVPIWVGLGFFASAVVRLVFGLLVGVLFCSAPFYKRHSPFLVARTGRVSWLAGQMVYMAAASFVLAVSVYFFVFLSILPRIGFFSDWGIVIRTLAESGSSSGMLYFAAGIERFSPLLANLASFGMIWLTGFFVGMFFTCFNLIFRRVISFSVYGFMLFMILSVELFGMMNWGKGIRYASPLSFVSLYYFRDFNNEGMYPPLWYGVCVLGGGILLFGALSFWRFCTQDLDTAGKEE